MDKAETLNLLAEARCLDMVCEDYRMRHSKSCRCQPCREYDYMLAHRHEIPATIVALRRIFRNGRKHA